MHSCLIVRGEILRSVSRRTPRKHSPRDSFIDDNEVVLTVDHDD